MAAGHRGIGEPRATRGRLRSDTCQPPTLRVFARENGRGTKPERLRPAAVREAPCEALPYGPEFRCDDPSGPYDWVVLLANVPTSYSALSLVNASTSFASTASSSPIVELAPPPTLCSSLARLSRMNSSSKSWLWMNVLTCATFDPESWLRIEPTCWLSWLI